MHSSFSPDIVSALEHLLTADYDRIRLRLWRKFGEQLRNIPDAPTPDDLLHDAIQNLLAGRRHCPLERVELAICLVNIVRSKVSHLYEKWKRAGIVKVSDEALNTVQLADEQDSELRENILAIVADDPLLTEIVEYRLDHPEAKARKIAEALGIDMQEMYNANRRLKARLKSLVPPTESTHSQGESADAAATS
ncbi:hypothetical protein U27_06135 [Candidatus Vecturithrix granuli]|uniref:Uncharacterized protein n=1 Tax=Vecturithrix granuli TaxID=1499967 RepID=A0A081C3K4_VECG1|nr:hypothetical protein U27_06135 [Candidatus Vecturithrix granuli]